MLMCCGAHTLFGRCLCGRGRAAASAAQRRQVEEENAMFRKQARVMSRKERELEAHRDRGKKIREHRATANEALAQARMLAAQKEAGEREVTKWRDRSVWDA